MVRHRDISASNLMYYRDGDGNVMGVLNDMDLASLIWDKGPKGHERTGTVPFMARQLLRGEVEHRYEHDIESFIWVLVWVCVRYNEGQLRSDRSRQLDEWAKADMRQCRQMKDSFVIRDRDKAKPSSSHVDNWKLANRCLTILQVRDAQARIMSEPTHPLSQDEVYSDLRNAVESIRPVAMA